MCDGEVTQLFGFFDNETQELKAALEAIEKSGFKLEDKETFFTAWVFKHNKELYNYCFDYYSTKQDDKIIKKIDGLLGDRRNSQPIILKDKCFIFAMRK